MKTTIMPLAHRMKLGTGILMGMLCVMTGNAKANLVLTEMDFATNTVEITNLSGSVFNGTKLEWCIPFAYGTLEGSAFSYAAGETRTYVISSNMSSTVGKGQWIYLNRTGGFSDETKVITGVVWGSSQEGTGRTNAVTDETNAWNLNTDFVPTSSVPAGHTIQLKSGSPPSATSASWEVAASNLGTYEATATEGLVLTEMDFATNTVEITNLSGSVFNGTKLEWCIPFAYGTLEGSAFSYAAGETKTYVISSNMSSTVGKGQWIYLNRTGGFSDETKVITGVVWGSSQEGTGRTNAVTDETNAWNLNTDFVPTPSVPTGHTIQLKPGSPTSATSASWEVAASNLGTYQATVAPPELELGIKKGASPNEVILFWPTSSPAGSVLKTSTTLQDVVWPAEGSVPAVVGDNNEVTVTVSGAAYYRLELP